MEIQHQEKGSKGSFYIGELNKPLAEMTYSKAGNALLIIDHTEVDDSLRGKGVGKLLLNALVAMVREKGIKVLPLCPFAKSVFDKDKSLGDVLR